MLDASSSGRHPQVDQLFNAIKRRQFVVWTLRLLVPLCGLLLFFVLIAPIVLGVLFPTAQFDAIRISGDRLVVDAPRAKGNLSDGGRYNVSAHSAETDLIDQNVVTLVDLLGDLDFSDGTTARATSADGVYTFSSEELELLSTIDILASNGDEGTIGSGLAKIAEQVFEGQDGVSFRFIDGTTLDADTMYYDAGRGLWTFKNFTLNFTSPEQELKQ
ncbi:hypothetical protein [Maritalea sp.]|uniref:hypothetical protein n=1 Tax=Maritalea sp. TaxID=2003361 RepID=UPI003EF57242